MPGTKRETKAYRCVADGISYPISQDIRDRIRAGERIVREEQGELRHYAEGARIVNPPSDLIESWLRRRIVEPASGTKDESTRHVVRDGAFLPIESKEVTDGA